MGPHTPLLATREAEGGAFPVPAHAAFLIALSGEVLAALAGAGLGVEVPGLFWRSWERGLMPQPLPLRVMVAGMCAVGRRAEAVRVCRELDRLPGYDAFPATPGPPSSSPRGAPGRRRDWVGPRAVCWLAARQGAMVAATVRARDERRAMALVRNHGAGPLARPLAEDEAESLLRGGCGGVFAVGSGSDASKARYAGHGAAGR